MLTQMYCVTFVASMVSDMGSLIGEHRKVKHEKTKWIEGSVYHATDELGDIVVAEAMCSNCKRWATQINPFCMVSYEFCPWCGEKMKGEDKNELH